MTTWTAAQGPTFAGVTQILKSTVKLRVQRNKNNLVSLFTSFSVSSLIILLTYRIAYSSKCSKGVSRLSSFSGYIAAIVTFEIINCYFFFIFFCDLATSSATVNEIPIMTKEHLGEKVKTLQIMA
jgi:hypothetical protein